MNILFTGAGFTKNFGGYLGDEMWALIFNHPQIQRQSKVRKLMLDNFDYESIYHKVLRESGEGSFAEDDKTAIKNALSNAYKQLDSKILALSGRTSSVDININNIAKHLLEKFADDRSKISYFFTLNQDLLIERLLSPHVSSKRLILPGGIPITPSSGSGLARESPLEYSDFITLPNKEEVNRKKSAELPNYEFNYIKLHGSYNWKSYDGSEMMVIGLDKEDQINREPLLSWYLDIFKEALSNDGVRLFVIGYGFRDKHINEIIASSIKEHGLQLYVLSPQKPSEFMNSLYLLCEEKATTIYESLYGYFPYDLSQVFSDGPVTEESKMITGCFFS